MFQLRQFNLQLASGALGAQGKNVENQAGAINHPAVQDAFQVALLRRRQFMVEDDQVGRHCRQQGGDFFDLALAGKGGRIRAFAAPADFARQNGAGRFSQKTHFLPLIFQIRLAKIELDDDRPLADLWTVKHDKRQLRNSAPAEKPRQEQCERLFFRLFQTDLHRAGRNHRRDGMLVHHLRDCILEQNHILVEGFDLALQFDAIHQINRNRHMLAPQGVEERVL